GKRTCFGLELIEDRQSGNPLMPDSPPRIVLPQVGLDGDRGIKVVARGLRDAGFHVIYSGLWHTPEAIVRTVADEHADWVGIGLRNGAHMTLMPRVLQLLREAGLRHVGVLAGSIIAEADILAKVSACLNAGVTVVCNVLDDDPPTIYVYAAGQRSMTLSAW